MNKGLLYGDLFGSYFAFFRDQQDRRCFDLGEASFSASTVIYGFAKEAFKIEDPRQIRRLLQEVVREFGHQNANGESAYGVDFGPGFYEFAVNTLDEEFVDTNRYFPVALAAAECANTAEDAVDLTIKVLSAITLNESALTHSAALSAIGLLARKKYSHKAISEWVGENFDVYINFDKESTPILSGFRDSTTGLSESINIGLSGGSFAETQIAILHLGGDMAVNSSIAFGLRYLKGKRDFFNLLKLKRVLKSRNTKILKLVEG